MDDIVTVGLVKGTGDLGGDDDEFRFRYGTSLQTTSQRYTVEIFHYQVVAIVFAANVEDGADVGMIERRDDASFTLEAAAEIVVGGEIGTNDFDPRRCVATEYRERGRPHPYRPRRRVDSSS